MTDKEVELSEHLRELRTRLIRAIVYVAIGTIIAWFLYKPFIYQFLLSPVKGVLDAFHVKFLLTELTEGFMLQCKVSIITGLIIAIPLVTFEVWRFVAPALKKEEKRPLLWIIPLCVLLFVMGITVAYFIFPTATTFFINYVPAGVELRPTVSSTITFVGKMLLVFGLAFELPVVLMFLGKLGIVDAQMLKGYWRQAFVGIAVIAAIITPSGDAFSMLVMTIPLFILYGLSIFLVRFTRKKNSKNWR